MQPLFSSMACKSECDLRPELQRPKTLTGEAAYTAFLNHTPMQTETEWAGRLRIWLSPKLEWYGAFGEGRWFLEVSGLTEERVRNIWTNGNEYIKAEWTVCDGPVT
jgi:hypothetical protein